MGGRMMPLECEHGRVFEWGDFGNGYAPEYCYECEAAHSTVRAKIARLVRRLARFIEEGA